MTKYEDYRGLRFFFFSNEEDRPHVHVRSQDGTAKFWLVPRVEIVDAGGLKPSDLLIAEERIKAKKWSYFRQWKK